MSRVLALGVQRHASGVSSVSAFCKFCHVGQLLRSTRDFRVSWCSHCFGIELPKAPPRGEDKRCPGCGAAFRPEWDETELDGQRLVYNLRYACNECGGVKPWPTDCYFCGAEEGVYDVRITEVVYRGRPTWTRDRLAACAACLPKVAQGFYDTPVDRVVFTTEPVDATVCAHCALDEKGLWRIRQANAGQGTLDLFHQLLCPKCRARVAALVS